MEVSAPFWRSASLSRTTKRAQRLMLLSLQLNPRQTSYPFIAGSCINGSQCSLLEERLPLKNNKESPTFDVAVTTAKSKTNFLSLHCWFLHQWKSVLSFGGAPPSQEQQRRAQPLMLLSLQLNPRQTSYPFIAGSCINGSQWPLLEEHLPLKNNKGEPNF